MLMDRFNVKGSDVSLDFNTISIITAELGLMCKHAIDLEYKGLTGASAKDLAKTFMIRFAFIMGKRLTRNLKILSQAKAAAPHYEVGEGSGGPKPTVPPKLTDHARGSMKDKRAIPSTTCVSPLGLDKDQVLTMIQNGRAARAKH
eukprot:jgi/Tetstr1/463050/TSEL_007988.t1